MSTEAIVHGMMYMEMTGCVAALAVIYRRQQLRQYGFLSAYLLTRVLSEAIMLPVYNAAANKTMSPHTAYLIYFYVFWFSYAMEAVLGFGIIYSVYNLAMAPLKGLQRLGRLMFRWAGAIAIAISVTTALGPHMTGNKFIMRLVTQLQQTQSILTLCLLVFVCLAIRPMGLSHRSKIFGVSLGLGVLAATDLISAAWLPFFKSMDSLNNVINGIAILSTLSIWIVYFALPEPKRRMIILPTTSPLLRWNQISMALGDEPGFTVVGDLTPDMFAPAEVEVMRRASVKMGAPLAPARSLTGTI